MYGYKFMHTEDQLGCKARYIKATNETNPCGSTGIIAKEKGVDLSKPYNPGQGNYQHSYNLFIVRLN